MEVCEFSGEPRALEGRVGYYFMLCAWFAGRSGRVMPRLGYSLWWMRGIGSRSAIHASWGLETIGRTRPDVQFSARVDFSVLGTQPAAQTARWRIDPQ